jgi:hypothetical protein
VTLGNEGPAQAWRASEVESKTILAKCIVGALAASVI